MSPRYSKSMDSVDVVVIGCEDMIGVALATPVKDRSATSRTMSRLQPWVTDTVRDRRTVSVRRENDEGPPSLVFVEGRARYLFATSSS